MAKMKMVAPRPDLHVFRDDLLELLRKHAGHLDGSEMLALSAYTVGQIIAMQDPLKVAPNDALTLVGNNIELGNAHAIENADKWLPLKN